MRPAGLEPAAYWFEASRSIQLSYGRIQAENDITRSAKRWRAIPFGTRPLLRYCLVSQS
jgi:hypothetical protein